MKYEVLIQVPAVIEEDWLVEANSPEEAIAIYRKGSPMGESYTYSIDYANATIQDVKER